MSTFTFQSEIADVDETIERNAFQLTTVIPINASETFFRVIVPRDVLGGRRTMLYPGRPVVIPGDVVDFPGDPTHMRRG